MPPEETVERLRRKARRFKFERIVATLAGLPALVALTFVFAAAAIFGEVALCRVGCAIIAASLAYTTYRLIRSDWSFDRTTDCVSHYRSHLIRRRDFLRRFAYWGGLPTGIGAALAALGWLLSEPSRWLDATIAGVLGVGLQIALSAGNSRIAAQLQKDIDLIID